MPRTTPSVVAIMPNHAHRPIAGFEEHMSMFVTPCNANECKSECGGDRISTELVYQIWEGEGFVNIARVNE